MEGRECVEIDVSVPLLAHGYDWLSTGLDGILAKGSRNVQMMMHQAEIDEMMCVDTGVNPASRLVGSSQTPHHPLSVR